MESVAVDLTALLKIHRADCIQDSGGVGPGRVPDLPAVPGVVQEVAGARFGNQPVDCCLLSLVNKMKIGNRKRKGAVKRAESGRQKEASQS
jgi:hypothetical protein